MSSWSQLTEQQLQAYQAQVADTQINEEAAEGTSFLRQPTWFVNPVTGSDQNDGASAEDLGDGRGPLATIEEYTFRIGSGTVLPTQVLNVSTGGGPTSLGADTQFFGNYRGGLTIIGERTIIRSGTITAVQVYDDATNTDGRITDSGVASWIPDVNRFIVLTSGANSGAVAAVAVDVAGGGDTCRYSPFWDDDGFTIIDPAVSDDYDIVEMTTISGALVFRNAGFIVLRDLQFDSSNFFGAIRTLSGQQQMIFCRINSVGGDIIGAGEEANFAMRGCIIQAPFMRFQADESFFHACLFTSFVQAVLGRFIISDDCIWQGTEGLAVVNSGFFECRNNDFYAVFDMPDASDIALNLRVGANGFVTGRAWGTGNDGAGAIGIAVDSGAMLYYSGDAEDRFGFAGSSLVESNIAGTAIDYATLASIGNNGANSVAPNSRFAGIVPGTFL